MKQFITLLTLGSICYQLNADDLKIDSRIYIDSDSIGPFYQKGSNQETKDEQAIELASLKTSVKYQLTDSIKTKLQVEFKKEEENNYDDELEIKDIYIRYTNLNHQLTTGRFKEPLGHEELMSSSDLPSIERSLVSSAFSPGRNLGFEYQYEVSRLVMQLGHFKIEDDDIKNGQSITARLSYSPVFFEDTENNVHIAIGTSHQTFDSSLFQIKERGEVNTADNIIQSARFNADAQTIIQSELGLTVNGLWLMGEYYQAEVNQVSNISWQYQGFYVQAVGGFNWKSPNRQLQYKYKSGEFKQPKMKAHDIEWVIRYSGLNLRDNEIGSEAASLLFGGNYYFNKRTSLMIDFLKPDISGNVVNTNQGGETISMRFRYFW